MKLAKILLDISKQDLAAAKCLYENELYSQAVFYLQQSVEKAAKAFGLLMGIISENELKGRKGIGHNPLKIHKKVADKQLEQIGKLKDGFEILPELKKTELIRTINIEEMHKTLEKFIRFYETITKEKSVYIPKDEIEQIIEELENFETKVQELKRNIHTLSVSESEISKLKSDLLEFFNTLYIYDSEKIEKVKEDLEQVLNPKLIEDVLRKLILMFSDVIYIHFSLFYFSIITFPHAVNTRYPEGELNPLEIYNREYHLVQLFEECFEIVNKTLKRTEGIMKSLNEQ